MLVSAIIPCYNVEDYIQECVESVFNQTYDHIEIICIDNNSTDKTREVLSDLQKNYPTLILGQELKKGAPAARNKGLSMAKGDWIQFLDADDLLLPEKISHQVDLIKDGKVAFVAGAYIKQEVSKKEITVVALNSDVLIAPFISHSGNTCSNLWNRESLLQINGWNENLKSSQEADLMLRLVLNNAKFILDEEPLTIVRARESGQISQNGSIENAKRYIEVRLSFLKELQQKHLSKYNQNKRVFDDTLIGLLINLYAIDKDEAVQLYKLRVKEELSGLKNYRSLLMKLIGLKRYIYIKSIL